jgi:hypothetical protein
LTFNKFLDQAKRAAGEARDTASRVATDARDVASRVTELSREKAGDTMDAIFREIDGLLPILRECGFLMSDLKFSIALPPEFVMIIDRTGSGKMTLEQILAERRPTISKLQETILVSLLKANELAAITARYGYTFGQYELELTLPPRVIIHLVSNKTHPPALPQPNTNPELP